jgi:hypothetical protein
MSLSRVLGQFPAIQQITIPNKSKLPYEFLTNRSGLLEKFFYIVGFVKRIFPVCQENCLARWWVFVGPHDYRYFHNDWFPQLLVSAICLDGVDARATAQVRGHE